MKVIVTILFFSFIVITLTPLAFIDIPSPQLACETECCVAEEDLSCDMEDLECCPPGMCNPAQCAFCCFLCPVSADKILIRVFDSALIGNPEAGQFMLTSFASDHWQPPELS